MYRDDPLDDEMELRAIVGDDEVDTLLAAEDEGIDGTLDAALDILRVLQGWVDDEEAGRWFTTDQQRLDGDTPIQALATGDHLEALDAARAWVAAQG